MSFAAQEQALLDLLFDRERREAFRRDPVAALAPYDLDEAERRDFAVIRPDALDLDATIRAGLILSQYCRSYPLSFSLASSLPDGLERLRGLVDAALLRTSPAERVARFGVRLRDVLREAPGLATPRERALLLSVVEAEVGMAWTAAQARAAALPGDAAPAAVPGDWLLRRVRLAPLTSAAVLPAPHARLKEQLCPCGGAELWRRLTREPLTAAQRNAALAGGELRLLVARAVVVRPSPCEPVIEHVTVELTEGFARLLPHLDGRTAVADLLAALRDAGAEDAVIGGVAAGFRQLWQQGMVTGD